MLALAVGAFEGMGTRLTFLCFEFRWVNFVIGLTVPCEFSMVDGLIQAITFDALYPLDSTNACIVAPLPVIFILGNTWIHVGTTNGSDESSYIEPLVDEGFGFRATLSIPDVNSYDGHVRFQQNLDYSQFGS